MPETLLFAFAKLIEFYRTDMTNDDPDVVAFMKTASVDDILKNAMNKSNNIIFHILYVKISIDALRGILLIISYKN